MLHSRNPPNRATKIGQYKLKKTKSRFEFSPRDTEESEYLVVTDFGDVAFLAQTVRGNCSNASGHARERVLHSIAVWCSVLQCVAVCCSVLQCVAVCCSVLQCVA